jgi:hypothetical protein
MSSATVSSSTIRASPIAMRLAREFLEDPDVSVLDLYQMAVEISLSFSTGSAEHDLDEGEPATDAEAAETLARAINAEHGLLALQGLNFPQAIVGSSADIAALRPPKISEGGPNLLSKPSGALWTSSFLTPNYPAWTAMVNTGYVPVDRPFECAEFFVGQGDFAVFTISSVDDFAALCEEFAAPHGPPAIDWRRVAQSYHAVHLTFTGLVLAQGVPVRTRLGTMTLSGWDSESTAWLRLPASARLGERRLVR